MRRPRDPILDRLTFDLTCARAAEVSALVKLKRARRAVELRQGEVDSYSTAGLVPRRKAIRDEAAAALVRALELAGGRRAPGGDA